MPMDRERYPRNWNEIALAVKEEAGWRCESCGTQCYRPGEPCLDRRRVLTVAHLDHTSENCARENLRALCSVCHLRYDVEHHRQTRMRRKLAGQTAMDI